MSDIIISGSTPMNRFDIPFKKNDIALIEAVYLQGGKEKVRRYTDGFMIYDGYVVTRLNEDETLSLGEGKKVQIQLRVRTVDRATFVSDILVVDVADCLFGEVMMDYFVGGD